MDVPNNDAVSVARGCRALTAMRRQHILQLVVGVVSIAAAFLFPLADKASDLMFGFGLACVFTQSFYRLGVIGDALAVAQRAIRAPSNNVAMLAIPPSSRDAGA